MSTIAIIAEGATDQVFIEELLFRIFTFDEEPEFVYAQPSRDLTHSYSAPHGGWELVLEYCETRFLDAVETNDFVIVQIDTDCGDHPNFGIDLCPGGIDRSDEQLRSSVIAKLEEKIGGTVLETHFDRVVFAVCVHSLESWIFLCLYQEHKRKNAFKALKYREGKRFQKDLETYKLIGRTVELKDFGHLLVDDISLGMFLNEFRSKVPFARFS